MPDKVYNSPKAASGVARLNGVEVHEQKSLLAILAIALVLGIGLTYRLMMMGTETSGAGAAAIGGPFELVNQDGKTVTQQDFKGKYELIYFGYTYCPDVCPTELQAMGSALDSRHA